MDKKVLDKNLSILQGHVLARDILNQSLERNSCSAYLLVGPPHVGKGLVARIIAASLHGLENANKKHIDTLIFDDLLEANSDEGEKKWKKSIDDLIHFINLTPSNSTTKVAIIEDIDRLSIQATNALLKTLEEPPRYAKIIITAQEADRVLPTIRSRSQIVKLNHLTDDEIRKYVTLKIKNNIEEIVILSNGAIGTASSLIKDPALLKKNISYIESFKTILNDKVSSSLKLADVKDREEALNMVEVWINLARRRLISDTGDKKMVELIKKLQALIQALHSGANIRIALESLILDWKWGNQR